MGRFAPLKVFAVALALAAFGLAGAANAQDDDARDIVTGIIGEVISGAIEAEQGDAQDAQCARLEQQCDAGSDAACDQADRLCE